MRRSVLAVVLGAAAVAAATAVVAGSHAGLVTLVMLLGLGGAALAATELVAARRRRVGSLGRQFVLAIAILVGQVLVAVVATAAAMFVSDRDAVLVSLIVAFAGLVAVVAARRLAGAVLADVERVRDGLVAVRDGRRDVRIETSGADELSELAAAANAMIARLAQEEAARDSAEAARRSLVASVSHDLRTPITSLRLLVDAVNDELVDAGTRREYLRRMNLHIGALGALIDDLFELSRIEAGDIRWSMERVRIEDLVDETVAAMRAQAQAKGVLVEGHTAAGLPEVRASPEKLQRLLFNLIQNAIRHTPADGSVVVRAGRGPDGVEVEVADTGEGIPAADRERVFEALYRGGATAGANDGAGLGLAVARAIVEAHGGRIWLADSERGTRVRFRLPRERAAPAALS